MRWIGVWCATGVLLIACASHDKVVAGGFDRFDQGVELLFDRSKLVLEASYGVQAPSRKFNTVNGLPETVWLGPNTTRPSINLKFTPFNDAACLAAFREPFGGDIDYGDTWSQARRVTSRHLKVEELSLTCSYRLPVAGGYVYAIGGANRDFASYDEQALRVLPNGSVIRPTLNVEDSSYGWRAGVAYEVPGKFIRASIIYYSPVDFFAKGTITQLPLGGNAFLPIVPVHSEASVPQTVEFIVQFPLAPGWLNTVAVKWADWSIWTRVPAVLSVTSGPLPAGQELSVYNAFFVDGWTISNTVSHRVDESLALAVRLSWDRGVATGWTEHTDSWSANLAAVYTMNKNLDVIGAIGVSILTAGEINKMAFGGSYNATFDTGSAFFARFGFRYRI
jgi:long-chain fatty acid transport protein